MLSTIVKNCQGHIFKRHKHLYTHLQIYNTLHYELKMDI